MYTVEEVAEQLGFSKVTIYAKLKKHSDMVVMKQGKKYVSDELLDLIKQELNIKEVVKPKEIETEMNEDKSIDREDLIKLNEVLIQQIQQKDKQIEDMQNTINELIRLNENNQILIKQQQDKEIKKLELEEHFKEVDEKLLDLREKMEDKKQPQKGFFNFFKR